MDGVNPYKELGLVGLSISSVSFFLQTAASLYLIVITKLKIDSSAKATILFYWTSFLIKFINWIINYFFNTGEAENKVVDIILALELIGNIFETSILYYFVFEITIIRIFFESSYNEEV